MSAEPLEAAVVSASSKTALVTGAATGVLAWVQSQDWIAVGGFLVALLTVLINWYYKRRHMRLEEELTRARIAALQRRLELDLSLNQEISAQQEADQ